MRVSLGTPPLPLIPTSGLVSKVKGRTSSNSGSGADASTRNCIAWYLARVTRTLRAIGLLALLACSTDDSGKPSREECEEVRRHIAKVSAAEAGRGLPPDELKKHEENLAAEDDEDATTMCTEQRSKKFVECVLAATTTEAFAACRNK
jgi:hypothetical protein